MLNYMDACGLMNIVRIENLQRLMIQSRHCYIRRHQSIFMCPQETNIEGTFPQVTIIASDNSWIEGEAIQQLNRVAQLPGVRMAVGMPDLHPGRGYPVGAAIVTENILYPHLVGNDVGCGMGLWQTQLTMKKFKVDRSVKKLRGLEGIWDGDIREWMFQNDIQTTIWDSALGTIGGGNHFAELQTIEHVVDHKLLEELGMEEGRILLLVHSGSRGLGESVLRAYTERHGARGIEDTAEAGREYLEKHDHAVRWAQANRALIAFRFFESLGTEGNALLDCTHNSMTKGIMDGCVCWIHRKGAAPSNAGPVVVPGSRGALTYLLIATGEQQANAYSLAHGAGRKWNRSSARDRLHTRYTPESLRRTRMGNIVICDNKELLYEEAPEAYKNIESVVQDMENAGLARVVATLRPLITYKVKND